jgi:nicotinate-nucleotide adenylyltransferase
MRIGIFGGSFDPVHFGHLLLAECCREQGQLDAVWFLPTAVPPHKQRELTAAESRIEMLELAIGGQPAFSVSRYEADRGGVNYTAETLAHFHEEDPAGEFFLLLGADTFRDLPHWRQPDRICKLALPMAVRRSGEPPLDFMALSEIASPQQIEAMRRQEVVMPEIGLSASDLRRRVAAGQAIRYRTPRAVEKYIETRGLYQLNLTTDQWGHA